MARQGKKWTPKTDDQRAAEVAELSEQLQEEVGKLTTEGGWAAWLEFQSKLHTYSFYNTLLIQMQHPGATAVAGYKAWQKLGRHVRKGEKSHIGIFAPMKRSYWTKETDPETGEEKKVRKSYVKGFRIVKVFEVSQTDGEPVPERPAVERLKGDDKGLIEVLKSHAESLGCSVRFGHADGANGYYKPMTREIVVEKSMEPAAQAKTLAHEIGHHILHGKEEGHLMERADKELEAESFAYIVCTNLGLETASYSFHYVACWKGKESDEGFQASGDRIAKAAKDALKAIDDAMESEPMSEAA
jgi:antirestriction protein ArdC